jgi:anthranilate/para-aminobenzoate synthase component I
VADSQPDAEWAETELKAARLLTAAGRLPQPASLATR